MSDETNKDLELSAALAELQAPPASEGFQDKLRSALVAEVEASAESKPVQLSS